MSVEIEVRPSSINDAVLFAPLLREADKQEMEAILGSPANHEAALKYGIEVSYQPYTGFIDGAPAAIFGVVPEPVKKNIGSIWMMGTEAIPKNPVPFLRNSKVWMDKMFEPFELLWNTVDKRNTLHIRWIKWLGFNFIREIPQFGEQRLPFLEFAQIKKDV